MVQVSVSCLQCGGVSCLHCCYRVVCHVAGWCVMSAVLLQGNVSCCRVVCHVCSFVTGECVMLQGGVSCLHYCCCRVALEEVKQDLQERLHRWHTLERLCGFPIITNPGLSALHQMLHGTREGPCLLGFPLSSLFLLLLGLGAGMAQWLEHQAHNRKVPSSSPHSSGRRVFFSWVSFLR